MRPVTTALTLCSVALFAGCSWFGSAKPTPEMQTEQDNAGMAYIECLRAQARQVDDHKSAPSTIAPRVVAACQQEYQSYTTLSKKGMSSGDAEEFDAMMNNPKQQLGVATDIVEYQRRER